VSEQFIGAAALTGRYVLAFVLLTAAVPKLFARSEFERAVANYDVLPLALVTPIAAWLPRIELACALALLVGIVVSPVAAAAGALMLVFAVAITTNLLRGRRIDCGCYSSVAPRRIGWWLVFGDLVLAGVAVTVALRDPGVLALVSESSSSLSAADGVATLTLAGALVLGYLLLSSWLSLRSSIRRHSGLYEVGARHD
jgi:uncharacterized membrane protein YphA (DoxX/SURF4 family)